MEVLLIGANKGLGYQVLKELLSKKITVNCLIRRKGLINFESKYLNIFYGDATNLSDLKKSIGNSECIISTINVQRKNIFPWSRLTNSKTTISDFAKNSIIASEDKINRIITISAWGVGESMEKIPKLFKFLIKFSNLKYPYIDHDIHEKVIENSNLNWTIIRPTALTNETKYHDIEEFKGKRKINKITIGRKSLAKYVVKIIDDKYFYRKKITVSRK
ncbi:MAG: NAD(P)-binding oxidoreductase [Chloroflexota bacterium]|jgi:putative NADH-flavin reductase|nr:NAD(P)-binding oxidoreductase [Chloroflexota bacterium]|tara:strand:+ start:2031 stop:2684 length:654 start_codon:yes stop_codon:yes gene_type:complete